MKTATREKPILFSGPMVKAILEGRKTQTRRIVKPPRGLTIGLDRADCKWEGGDREHGHCFVWGGGNATYVPCPYGQPGDRLWVRETWADVSDWDHYNRLHREGVQCFYRATDRHCPVSKWRPSIFMPRWASRITLEITNIRVERLQEISRLDIYHEGWPCNERQLEQVNIAKSLGGDDECIDDASIEWFAKLWESINGLGSWDANLWVWVVEFERVKP